MRGLVTWRSVEEHSLGRLHVKLLKDLGVQHWEDNHLLEAADVLVQPSHMTEAHARVQLHGVRVRETRARHRLDAWLSSGYLGSELRSKVHRQTSDG